MIHICCVLFLSCNFFVDLNLISYKILAYLVGPYLPYVSSLRIFNCLHQSMVLKNNKSVAAHSKVVDAKSTNENAYATTNTHAVRPWQEAWHELQSKIIWRFHQHQPPYLVHQWSFLLHWSLWIFLLQLRRPLSCFNLDLDPNFLSTKMTYQVLDRCLPIKLHNQTLC